MPYGRTESSHAGATDLVALFIRQLAACRLSAGELCICVTDTAWNPAYAAACVAAAQTLGAEAYQTVLSISRPLPARGLGAAWKEADLIVYMTSFTLHYRPEIRTALDTGTRVLCVMQPLHVMRRLTADADIRRRTKAGAELLGSARTITIHSDAGTELVMDKSGRHGLAHYGFADEPGHLDFWGGAMAQAAQVEGTLEGRLVLDIGDCCFHLGRFVEQRTSITFRRGVAVEFSEGLDAFLIRNELESAGDSRAFLAGHMAWGTDRRAKWTQPLVQVPDAGGGGADTEAFYGCVQIEIGSNDDVLFRGVNRTSAHLGLCLRNASLSLDGRPVIVRGEFVDEALADRRIQSSV